VAAQAAMKPELQSHPETQPERHPKSHPEIHPWPFLGATFG